MWFLKEVGLDPARTNAVLALTPLITAAAAFACQRCSRVLGRIQTCLMFRSMGVALLLWMGLQPAIWKQPWVPLVFMARTALTNCGYPVRRSILMDFVPKSRCVKCLLQKEEGCLLHGKAFHQRAMWVSLTINCSRAKWSSMQVLFQFGWSGSAVLGGWLVDRFGFQVAFLVTGMCWLLYLCFDTTTLRPQAACRHVQRLSMHC